MSDYRDAADAVSWDERSCLVSLKFWGLGFGVQGSGFRVWGALGLRV